MKKKSLVAMGLAGVMTVGMCVPVLADTTVNATDGTGGADVTYIEPEAFSVTIPSTITMNKWRSAGATSARPRRSSIPLWASCTSMAHRRLRRSAYILVNPGGMCWTMTMGGMSAGRRFMTSRVASVPPVEAPRPMMTLFRLTPAPSFGMEPAATEGTPGAGRCIYILYFALLSSIAA